MRAQKPRQIAARLLARAGEDGEFIESSIDRDLAESGLERADRALCQNLVYGVVRWRRTLDWLIARKATRPPTKPALAAVLRLGLYQMFWLDRVPDHAAVNDAVELAKEMGARNQAGFVNATLRSCGRERAEIEKLLAGLKTEQPALGFSHPDWLCERWQARWGADETAKLLEWDNLPAPAFARLNALKTDAATLEQAWAKEGLEWMEIQRDWTGRARIYQLSFLPSAGQLASFRNGWFYVQDPSTLLAVHQLAPKPGETILDMCAAPGGKTFFAAQLMENRGRIVARDGHESRLSLLRENRERLGTGCVEINPAGPEPSRFDGILVDAPCSNTGVLRRRVEARWRVQPAEIERLGRAQAGLLRQAAPLLKKGGRLVYSTCSLETDENENVVQNFLGEFPEFKCLTERTLLPFRDQTDGAFVAVLGKG